MKISEREIWIDWLRVVALLLVMLTHCCEPFYLGGDGSQVLTHSDAVWVAIFDAVPRACVPLFVVASSYLLFPLRYSTSEFFKKRVVRVLVPFVIWTVAYALASDNIIGTFKDLVFNFNYAAGHLWFVYMLVGLYLIMPMLSPWAERVGKRELQVYLVIWLFTTIIPLIRVFLGGEAPVVTGTSGIPNIAKFPLWGECSWNSYGTFYYLSGFVGYMLLGLYFRKFVAPMSWCNTLRVALPSFFIGFAICSLGFLHNVEASANGVYPVGGTVSVAALWESAWFNDTLGVALMTIGWILVLRKLHGEGWIYRKLLLPVSEASYGMYLCHMFLLTMVSASICQQFGVGVDGCLGLFTTPFEILSSTIITFVFVAIICVMVRRVPVVGKYIM